MVTHMFSVKSANVANRSPFPHTAMIKITLLSALTWPAIALLLVCLDRSEPHPPQAIHDPIETDDTWINGRSCESISAENSSVGENDETNYDNRKIACGMVAQVKFRLSVAI